MLLSSYAVALTTLLLTGGGLATPAFVAWSRFAIGTALIQWNLLDARVQPALNILGKLAMADIFLIALYITLAKGISYATIETAWGLYLFSACILASIALGHITEMTSTSRKAQT
mgnify:CR=1 FL=1